jgi:hypothetical protein
MEQDFKKSRVLCLLLLSLFLLEYMEPSAIGVRAFCSSPLTAENPDRENPPSSHAMGVNTIFAFETKPFMTFFVALPGSDSSQPVFFEIDRPPLPRR